MPAESPPNIQPNDIVECTFRGELCAQTILNVWHYRYDGAGEGPMDTLLDSLHNALVEAGKQRDKFIAAAAPNYTLTQIVLQVIRPVRFARFPYDHDDTGLMAEDASTADLAAVIEKSTWFATDRTTGAARGMNGTLHFAPVPGDKIEDGLIDNTYRTLELSDLGSSIISRVVTADGGPWQPVIYHRGETDPPYTDIHRFDVKQEARVMRRRTVGRGI